MNNTILKIVFCSYCGTEYKISGSYKEKNSSCCNKPLTIDERAIYINRAKLEIQITKLLNGEK